MRESPVKNLWEPHVPSHDPCIEPVLKWGQIGWQYVQLLNSARRWEGMFLTFSAFCQLRGKLHSSPWLPERVIDQLSLIPSGFFRTYQVSSFASILKLHKLLSSLLTSALSPLRPWTMLPDLVDKPPSHNPSVAGRVNCTQGPNHHFIDGIYI